jgi:hypothetical protein
VNPVASQHFNFSVPEPTGVVSVIAPEDTSLLGLVSTILPVIAGGSTCVVLASEIQPLCAVTFAEVLATLYRHLGIDPAEASLRDHTGRPQYLLDNPTPLPELG